jgi:flagellar biosynthesis/type III secretory pathway chaperone
VRLTAHFVESQEVTMAQHPTDWSQLDQSLHHDAGLTAQLLDLLEQERRALESRHYQHFDQLLGDKQRLVGELEQGAETRRQWLAAHGFADDAAALARAQAEAPEVGERWRAAAAQWRECQRANDLNEQICRRTRIVVEQVLDILHGQPGQSSTYDASGLSQRPHSRRTITSV